MPEIVECYGQITSVVQTKEGPVYSVWEGRDMFVMRNGDTAATVFLKRNDHRVKPGTRSVRIFSAKPLNA